MAANRLSALAPQYDLIIVGGGVSGAGLFREASRSGLRVLLVDARDFASGTSSASSKLVHGGLRYLKNGQWRLTLESVRERQILLREAPGLVQTLPFLMPIYRDRPPGRWLMRFGLWLYDRMAGRSVSRWLDAGQTLQRQPQLRREQLLGAMYYEDAQTDDARLVLRLLQAGRERGQTACNYMAAQLLREGSRVSGVRLHDAIDGGTREIGAALVVSATGAGADQLTGDAQAPRLRPLRGSHLVFPAARWPLRQAVSWLHPRDRRPVFAYPWLGAVLYGTTDLDHAGDRWASCATAQEIDYLLEGAAAQFPDLHLQAGDALCSFAGVRPVLADGEGDPSSASRESALWQSPGLIGIAGGKLTTFRLTARQVLRLASRELPALAPSATAALFDDRDDADILPSRFGRHAAQIRALGTDELQRIGDTPYCWAELRWSLRHESVQHLDDLLLRRTRLGLLCAAGGAEHLPRIAALCQVELDWDQMRWQDERARYLALWRERHASERGA